MGGHARLRELRAGLPGGAGRELQDPDRGAGAHRGRQDPVQGPDRHAGRVAKVRDGGDRGNRGSGGDREEGGRGAEGAGGGEVLRNDGGDEPAASSRSDHQVTAPALFIKLLGTQKKVKKKKK